MYMQAQPIKPIKLQNCGRGLAAILDSKGKLKTIQDNNRVNCYQKGPQIRYYYFEPWPL